MAWELAYPLGALALLLILAFGMYQYKSRNRANDRITDEATRELYSNPTAYEHGGREQLERQLEK